MRVRVVSSEVRIVKQADWNAMYEPYKANAMLSLHTHIALDASDEYMQRHPHLIGLADMHHCRPHPSYYCCNERKGGNCQSAFAKIWNRHRKNAIYQCA